TAAFSILDHMDGLVSGVAAIASFFFALLAIMNGQVLVASLGAAVLGASLGFLRWNFKPAKIFMGDGGAMFLGFMVATLGLKLRLTETPQSIAWMVPAMVLAVPVFDTMLVIISRSRRGLLPFASPGKDHTAHRLANLGLGQRGAVLVIYGVGDRKSTRLNSSHGSISYAVFCLKKKNMTIDLHIRSISIYLARQWNG